jgi:ArsR family transcriptional regulator
MKMKVLTEQEKSANDQEEMAKFSKALAHPIRLEILRLLSIQSCCFTGDLVALLHKNIQKYGTIYNTLKDTCAVSGEIKIVKDYV